MLRITLSSDEIKILISGLKSKKTREFNRGGLWDNKKVNKIASRIKFLENLK